MAQNHAAAQSLGNSRHAQSSAPDQATVGDSYQRGIIRALSQATPLRKSKLTGAAHLQSWQCLYLSGGLIAVLKDLQA